MAEQTAKTIENLSYDILLNKNSDQLQNQGDLLVLFIHWYVMEEGFFLHENEHTVFRFGLPARMSSGGFCLLYSKDQLKLEITILHSIEKLTIQLKPINKGETIIFMLKFANYIDQESKNFQETKRQLLMEILNKKFRSLPPVYHRNAGQE